MMSYNMEERGALAKGNTHRQSPGLSASQNSQTLEVTLASLPFFLEAGKDVI